MPKNGFTLKAFEEEMEKESFCKSLPIINVLLKKIEEEEHAFNPIPHIEDKEQYFANLKSWKNNFEEQLFC